MQFTCKCLNVTVNVSHECIDDLKTPDLSIKTPSSSSNNQIVDQQNFLIFFKKAIGPIETSKCTIQHVHQALIECCSSGSEWELYRCLNCKTIVFASEDGKDGSGNGATEKSYLINSECLKTDDEVQKIRLKNSFSNIFGIELLEMETIMAATATAAAAAAGGSHKWRIKELEWFMLDAIKRQTAEVEEKIRIFSSQQYAQLKMHQIRAEQDFSTLCNVINNVPEIITTGKPNVTSTTSSSSKMLMETPPATPDNTPMSIGNSPPLGVAPSNVGFFNKKVASVQQQQQQSQSTPTPKSAASILKHSNSSFGLQSGSFIESSLDSDGIFDLDGMNDPDADVFNRPASPSEGNDLHTDDDEEEKNQSDEENDNFDVKNQNPGPGMKMTSNRYTNNHHSSIAKSLPITMPTSAINTFRSAEKKIKKQQQEEELDIAASIKALARSVHGDSIFGDLPQPRRPKFITDI